MPAVRWLHFPIVVWLKWSALDALIRLGLIAGFVIALTMLLLGSWSERRIRESWISASGEAATLYLGSYLDPLVQELAQGNTLSPEAREAVTRLVKSPPLAQRIDAIKVWDRDGNLVFSTRSPQSTQRIDPAILTMLREGRSYASLQANSHGMASGEPHYLEAYAPLHHLTTRTIIGFGEFYQRGEEVDRQIAGMASGLWHIIIMAMTVMGLLILILCFRAKQTTDKQRYVIRARFRKMQELNRHNAALRRMAEQARLDSIGLNEAYLAEIGSEIHDGPIQILTLALLKSPAIGSLAPAVAPELAESTGLVRASIEQLRSLSSGLILPELKGLPLSELGRRAVSNYIDQTGNAVALDMGPLPEPRDDAVGLCLYRIIREGLMNSFKHAQGRGQTVSIQHRDGAIVLEIGDAGPVRPVKDTEPERERIGLRGIRARLAAIGGDIALQAREVGGLSLYVTIPLAASPADEPPKLANATGRPPLPTEASVLR